jgi:hypothetical protein
VANEFSKKFLYDHEEGEDKTKDGKIEDFSNLVFDTANSDQKM